MNQEELDHCSKKLAEKMVEEVFEKYNVENIKREAYKGRGSPLKWRKSTEYENWRRLLGKNLRFVQGIQLAVSAELA